MRIFAIMAAVGAAILPTPALADPAAAATNPARQSNDAYMNERICETIVETGSRIGGHRYCATRAEWLDKQKADRETVEKAQLGACMTNHNGGTGKPAC